MPPPDQARSDAAATRPPPANATQQARRDWLAVLAQAPRASLARLAPAAVAGHAFAWLRRPEIGLVMLRGRIGNSGDRFNLGEASVTRCALRCEHGGAVTVGLGHVLGRDEQRAEWIAALDALLQQPALHGALMASTVEPLRADLAAARAAEQARLAPSRVRFHELQAEVAR
ncbi:phosphonate C-P lyase system protein PhnG [Derxia lacustris]|uniref:phosphonate C-P lyase system protein PhnG n=1 Tax=Derxia lacustris TaxID=764842 RepID=UPI000A171FC5|nr:phosphonate C-P lyase system protein PhnG [Derxia lacustris]